MVRRAGKSFTVRLITKAEHGAVSTNQNHCAAHSCDLRFLLTCYLAVATAPFELVSIKPVTSTHGRDQRKSAEKDKELSLGEGSATLPAVRAIQISRRRRCRRGASRATPPASCIRLRTMASPRPVPRCLVVKKGSQTRCRKSSGIPEPLSWTVTTKSPSSIV